MGPAHALLAPITTRPATAEHAEQHTRAATHPVRSGGEPSHAPSARVAAAPPPTETTSRDAACAPRSAPVPGWVALVRLAHAAAAASDPPASFTSRIRWGRIVWEHVRGPRSFGELLWALEELSSSLCELCGAPAVSREAWDGVVRTLCPRHRVDVTAAGPRTPELYEQAWIALGSVGAKGAPEDAAEHDRGDA